MTVRSGWLVNRDAQGGGQTRADTRLVPVGTWTPQTELTSRGGIVPGGTPFALTSAGAMQCTIGTGRALITGSTVQGSYPVAVTEPETLTIADGDAQYPRKDSIILRVYDTAYDGSGQTTAALMVVQGTPAANPTAPVASGTAEKLYEILVPAGTSAGTGGINWATGVSDRRRTTVSMGGIQAGGWSLGYTGSYTGQYRDNGSGLERWNGTAWSAYPAVPQWKSFTPVWGAENGAQPTLGNGTLTCRYLDLGSVVHFRTELVIGSTTSWGGTGQNGQWFVTLPVPCASGWAGNAASRARLNAGYYTGTADITTYAGPPGGVVGRWNFPMKSGDPTGAWADADDPEPPVAGSWYRFWGAYERA
ncbi:hypothetical protein [Streptomyces sp. URMC 124]|uniref:hypothetical protein n=1 Tax=Streptomyces sp. URMC 124 TaxID=3423405 RepID=UPI003F1DA6A5